MKGLWIKDWKLLKNQKGSFLMAYVVGIVIILLNMKSISFIAGYVLSYVTFVSAMLVLTTISYDEFENGRTFLFTLPFRRSEYVTEKYLFGIAAGTVTIMAMIGILMGTFLALGKAEYTKDLMITAAGCFVLLVLFTALIIPFQLKYGSERGRIALIIAFFFLFGISYGLFTLLKKNEELMQTAERVLEHLGVKELFLAGTVLAVVAVLVSVKISVGIMKKKEF